MSTSIFLLWLVSIPLAIHAAPNKNVQPHGFLLNCGGSEKIEQDSLTYTPDDNFIKTGNKSEIQQEGLVPLLSSVRYFPDDVEEKFCYHFPVNKGRKWLVKTIYYYGGFDGGKEPPIFDQIIDGTKWNINTTADYAEGLSSYYEIIMVAHNKVLSICLAKNEHTTSNPFISAIELLYLDDSLYNSTDFGKYALVTLARHSFGSHDTIIFPDDKFNRYWYPLLDDNPVVTSHTSITPSAFWNMPPEKLFENSITASRGKTLVLNWPPFPVPKTYYYIALYFQDSRTPSPFSWRVFDVLVNGAKFYSNLNVTTDGVTVYSTTWPLEGETKITLIPPNNSPVGPVIAAGELFQLLPLAGLTLTRDVAVMEDLRKSFNKKPQDWHGDPCLPKDKSWTGVTCSSGMNTRIISLNLTNAGISGPLPPSISKLTALTHLWLGSNELTGQIPDLSQLKNLETLHLENNQLQGSIPESLGQLPKLKEVFLQNNHLKGSIPASLKNKNGINLKVTPGNEVSS
ncbi:putative LRR receptor-like serine/threonine-protein kinase At1g51810 [Nicotiana tabacum]|uniref:LRR receptor-like serine/threonine-protein kinase At1g51810 n=1 Tax=Nicotiana tabacum TaxID=4097 RepID=A0A1S4A2B5_TOBAC|nr:PREDICTED: probable LRR receptor-like serine/threonine-protein kinase At1g67720 isoform X1 [Nicotiana tabacum]